MEPLEAHGEYPETVYRVFDDIKYAKAFINGSLRFSRLQNYKHIEDELNSNIIMSFKCHSPILVAVKKT